MKQVKLLLFFCLPALAAFSQNFDLEGLKTRLNSTTNDTLRLTQLDSLYIGYSEQNPDSSILYAEAGIKLARALGFTINEAAAINMRAYALLNLGNYPASLQGFLSGIEIAGNPRNEKNIIPEKYRHTFGYKSDDFSPKNYRLQILAFLYFNMGILYENAGGYEKALSNYFRALHLGEQTNNKQITGGTSMTIGRVYLFMNKNDSALFYEKNAYAIYRSINLPEYEGSALLNLGRIYLADGKEAIAESYIHEAIRVSTEQKYLRGVVAANLLLAEISLKKNHTDSAFIYTGSALQIAKEMNAPDLLLRSYNTLSGYYQTVNNNDSLVKYLSLVIHLKDSLFNSKQSRQFQNIDFDARQRQRDLEEAKKNFRDKVMKYALLTGLVTAFVIALILWRNFRIKQTANRLLTTQKQETERQKNKVEQTLEELKKTQTQLIQREKMASLGELTSGIAHEIQNPLNFVNNFSDINRELAAELESEIDKGNYTEARTLVKDIMENEEKVNHHGKRADAIVKGMLQHSQRSNGQKEDTDINALCGEYLKLACHTYSVSGNPLNVKFETRYDPSAGKLNVVHQDIGRVILNLVNNAVYAVNEKARQQQDGYEPVVTITTRKTEGKTEIIVSDNGTGIPGSIRDKIFQPFFTTKPAGEGIGLGLSLSYDIVKVHGGEISIESTINEGTRFTIQLPHTNNN